MSGSEDLCDALRLSLELFDNRHKKSDAVIDRTAMLRTAFMSPEVQVRLQHIALGSSLKEHILSFIDTESEIKWS